MSDGTSTYQQSITWDAPVIGHKAVTTAGTQLALVSVGTFAKTVIIQAKGNNNQSVFIGGSTVPNTRAGGVELSPGSSIEIGNVNLAHLYVNSLVDGEGVTWMYFPA
jgi:hypothetical protein